MSPARKRAEAAGKNDALAGQKKDLGKYNAKAGDQWAGWYSGAYDTAKDQLERLMLDDWDSWHYKMNPDEVPAQNISHKRGFMAGLRAAQKVLE